MSPLEFAKDQSIEWEIKARKQESSKNSWVFLCALMGLFLLIQLCAWASTPEKFYEVVRSADKPEITFIYRFWSTKRETHYVWGKNSDGEPCWLSVDESGRPDGGSIPKDDLGDN